jgi:hypothetical protein
MSCPFEIDVVRWVTGDTRLNELPRVEQHVSECASCRSKAEALRSILNRIAEPAAQGETNESSPKVFVDSVMEKIGREGAPRAGGRSAKRFALAAGFAIPLALAGGWTALRISKSNEALQRAAASDRSAEVSRSNGELSVVPEGRSQPAGAMSLPKADAGPSNGTPRR